MRGSRVVPRDSGTLKSQKPNKLSVYTVQKSCGQLLGENWPRVRSGWLGRAPSGHLWAPSHRTRVEQASRSPIYPRYSQSPHHERALVSAGERTGAIARASAAAALVQPAAEPWLAVVVQAAARKVQRLAATWELPQLAGAEMAASACAPAPTAAEALLSWAAGSARAAWQCRGTFVPGSP